MSIYRNSYNPQIQRFNFIDSDLETKQMKIASSNRQKFGKETLIKYLNPSSLIQQKTNKNRLEVSNLHCRSMEELDFNANIASHSLVSKQNLKTNIHHTSLFSDKDSCKNDQSVGKSKSLSKFIAFFENSNLLNPTQIKKENKEVKRNNYNGFSYDLKISANSSTANNKKILKKKDKENINYQTLSSQRQLNTFSSNNSTLILKNQNLSPKKLSSNQAQQILLGKMKQLLEEQKRKQTDFSQKIYELQSNNRQLQAQKSKLQSHVIELTRKLSIYEEKIKELQTKCKEIHDKNRNLANREGKNCHKENREQEMVIKSLKKVINQQLNKIIELERFKIENQYLKEKLSLQDSQEQSQNSFSQQEYSFQDEHKNQKKSTSCFSSTCKPTSQSIYDYGQQNFKKSRQKNVFSSIQNQNKNGAHFKSIFQIQESPISAQDNKKRLFKISQSNNDFLKKNPKNIDETKEGPNMIKIVEAQSSFSREAIEEVNEQNDDNEFPLQTSSKKQTKLKNSNNQKQEQILEVQDSILQEVDQYLTKWRSKQ